MMLGIEASFFNRSFENSPQPTAPGPEPQPAPAAPRDRLADSIAFIATAAAVPVDDVRAVVADWRAALIARGSDPAAADKTLTWEARRIPKTSYALVALRERMRATLAERAA